MIFIGKDAGRVCINAAQMKPCTPSGPAVFESQSCFQTPHPTLFRVGIQPAPLQLCTGFATGRPLRLREPPASSHRSRLLRRSDYEAATEARQHPGWCAPVVSVCTERGARCPGEAMSAGSQRRRGRWKHPALPRGLP